MTSTLEGMLEVFDVRLSEPGMFVGGSDAGERDIIDGSQLFAQAIVAGAKSLPAKTVRQASVIYSRPAKADEDIYFGVQAVQDGKSFGAVIVTASQSGKPCATVTILLDTPCADVIRHPSLLPASTPSSATPLHMPMQGREIRLIGVSDPNDPDEVGPPEIDAWLKYEPKPARDDLRRALLAHFTGHLGISATMRGHAGIGTAMSHRTISTAPVASTISFHDPVDWQAWILYSHESTYVGAGMSYVRGQVRTEEGELIASFSQDAMIRAFDQRAPAATLAERARL